jgi:general secretion pathway protein G
VELLIVIVVIAILAAISIVAYNGIQDRANDAAVKSDLTNIAKKFELFRIDDGYYPVGSVELASLDISVTKSAYGTHLSTVHNLLYCRLSAAPGPEKFALIAGSKSGNVFVYKSESTGFEERTSWYGVGSPANCQGAGVNQTNGSDRDFFYLFDTWESYAG